MKDKRYRLIERPKMFYSKAEQYRRANIIIDTVCNVGGTSWLEIRKKDRELTKNIVIGVIAYICWEYCVHARVTASLLNRTRGNIINQSKRYMGYIKDPTDKRIYSVYEESIERLKHILPHTSLKNF